MPYPVSARFISTLSGANVVWASSCSILSNGSPVAGFTDLAVEEFDVTASRANAQWYSISVTLTASDAIMPTSIASTIAPNGNEITFSIGLKYPDGTTELVPCGIFPIVEVDIDDTGTDITFVVSGNDRSISISRRALLAPYTIPDDYTVNQAIAALVGLGSATMPAFSEAITPTTILAPNTAYDQGQDPWAAATDVANGIGNETSFDFNGNLFAYPTPDPAAQPVSWTFVG